MKNFVILGGLILGIAVIYAACDAMFVADNSPEADLRFKACVRQRVDQGKSDFEAGALCGHLKRR